jgi:hypothetical protein
MPYGKNEIKNSNINYVGKDFNDLKSSLIGYTKSYFPNAYKDFNETSPGMMLVELSAYVGDVLNFYVDQQYREMMLPLTEDRRNIITLAKSYGYKTKAITPAYVDLTIKDVIPATVDGQPDYSHEKCITIDRGMKLTVAGEPSTIFETLDVVDFKVSSSADIKPEVLSVDSTTGIPSEYTLIRKVKAISGETTTTTFTVGEPQKFLKLTLPETNVIEILKVTDTNGNLWYEVETLAQDKIPTIKHYTSDDNRSTAYSNLSGDSVVSLPVPYSLEYIKTSKRFTAEVDENNKTILTFGNGVLKNGNTFNASFLAVEQQGINLPGGEEDLESEIDPLLGDAYGTLGEAPSQTTFTITYRIGGGVGANIPSGNITTINSITTLPSGGTTTGITVTNDKPAVGGSSGETIEEIRHRAINHISTQNRCVTKQDYEARALNMSAKFGNIAKVYCARSGAVRTAQRQRTQNLVDKLKQIINKNYDYFNPTIGEAERKRLLYGNENEQGIKDLLDADKSGGLNPADFEILFETLELTHQNVSQDDRLYTVDLYLLSYDNNKNLINTPNIVKQNLKQYLNQHRLITDQVSFYDGYIINFGVVFDVVAQQYENKDDVKFRCIQAIKDYFRIEKMQFKQILYTNDINQLLMDVDGVRAVNYATITQDKDYNAETGAGGTEVDVFSPGLFTTLIQSNGTTSTTSNSGYGYYYDFSKFYGKDAVVGNGITLPAYEPAVFELKNPNQNIKGIVR